jgi:hypothetical protein
MAPFKQYAASDEARAAAAAAYGGASGGLSIVEEDSAFFIKEGQGDKERILGLLQPINIDAGVTARHSSSGGIGSSGSSSTAASDNATAANTTSPRQLLLPRAVHPAFLTTHDGTRWELQPAYYLARGLPASKQSKANRDRTSATSKEGGLGGADDGHGHGGKDDGDDGGDDDGGDDDEDDTPRIFKVRCICRGRKQEVKRGDPREHQHQQVEEKQERRQEAAEEDEEDPLLRAGRDDKRVNLNHAAHGGEFERDDSGLDKAVWQLECGLLQFSTQPVMPRAVFIRNKPGEYTRLDATPSFRVTYRVAVRDGGGGGSGAAGSGGGGGGGGGMIL